MTGFMHERELSRKTFIKGGGALVVGFSFAGSALVGKATSATAPTSAGYNPDQTRVDSFLTLNPVQAPAAATRASPAVPWT